MSLWRPTQAGYRPLLMAVCIAASAGCTREKDRLDDEVRRLCAKDGGVKVYELVKLPTSEYQKLLNQYGELDIPNKRFAKPDTQFFQDIESTNFLKGNPEMWRSEYRLIRRSDQKVVAAAISYTRRGGDLPGPWQDSHFTCPDAKSSPDMANSVFQEIK